MSKSPVQYSKISRPRFWIYLLGPFLVGAAAAWPFALDAMSLIWMGVFALYFTWPANFFVYGVNDVFDWETDRLNKKKENYESVLPKEHHRIVLLISFITSIVILGFGFYQAVLLGLVVAAFIFFSAFYSMTPIRAKAIPFLDFTFNVLYIIPGVVAYVLIAGEMPNILLIVAAWLWAAAMHAYSAVPDIEADQKAGVATVATALKERKTILLCASFYALAAIISFSKVGWYAVFGGVVYVLLMGASLNKTREDLMKIYARFPLINTAIGFGLFFVAL